MATNVTSNADAFSYVRSGAAAAGINLGTLSDVAATAITVYNILSGGAANPQLAVPLGIGTAPVSNAAVNVGGTVTVASAIGYGILSAPTVVAAANSDQMFGLRVVPTYTPGAFTGLRPIGLSVAAYSVAGFTSPGDPAGLAVGIVTGTGATNAVAVSIAPPTGATNNYLIAHTTPATFNVTAAGEERVTRLGIGKATTATSPFCASGIPTSSAGLASGDFWLNSNVLTIIP